MQGLASVYSMPEKKASALTLAAANAKPEALGLVSAKALIQCKVSGQAPQLRAPCALSEMMVARAQDGAASAFAWALATGAVDYKAQGRPLVFWVQDRMSAMEAGKPYLPGLGGVEDLAQRFVLIQAKAGQDMLWAMEEALLSGSASSVIGEIWGVPKALNFTATKRLQRAAQIGKTPCLLLRYGQEKPASGAYERWCVASQPSAPHCDDPAAPGLPRWHLDLFKARTRQPSVWNVEYDRKTHHLHLAAPLADGQISKSA